MLTQENLDSLAVLYQNLARLEKAESLHTPLAKERLCKELIKLCPDLITLSRLALHMRLEEKQDASVQQRG